MNILHIIQQIKLVIMRYEVRKEVECGCTIFSVYNTETNTRVNYFATAEEAQAFAHRQEAVTARRKQNRSM